MRSHLPGEAGHVALSPEDLWDWEPWTWGRTATSRDPTEVLKVGLRSLLRELPVSLIEAGEPGFPSRLRGDRPDDQSPPRLRVIVGGVNVAMTTETLVTEPN